MRSVCRRSIITMSTSSRPRCMSLNTSTPKPLDTGRQQRGRADHPHPRAHRLQQEDVRARHPAVQDVAADRHGQALEPALAAADGERVEQRLGRMLVRAVAGVDDGAVHVPRQQRHRARCPDAAPPARPGAWRSASSPCRSASRPSSWRSSRPSMLTTSAPSRLPASSKLVCVRVLLSKNRLITVRPASTSRRLVDGAVLVDVAFGKVEQARNGVGRKTFDAEQMGQPRHAHAFSCH